MVLGRRASFFSVGKLTAAVAKDLTMDTAPESNSLRGRRRGGDGRSGGSSGGGSRVGCGRGG